MINTQMKTYDVYELQTGVDDYGQEVVNSTSTGTIKMAINLLSHTQNENPLYNNCSYIGLTHKHLKDSNFIALNDDEMVKVSFVNEFGRYYQVYLEKVSDEYFG